MTIKKRTLGDGTERFTVQWQIGGGRSGAGPSASETFSSRARAEDFQTDVRSCGWHWPEGWVKGEGYVQASDPVVAAVSFSDVAADFLAVHTKRMQKGRLKPYTLHRYERDVTNHLEPHFGRRPFTHITPETIEAWVQLQMGYDAAAKSIKNRHGLLYQIMEHGQKRMSLRTDNPCELSELPEAQSKRDHMFLLHWEWQRLRACLRSDAQLLCDVLLATGMRWGEVSALRLQDCQILAPDRVAFLIHNAWSKRAPSDPSPIHPDLDENKSWVLGTTKNSRSRKAEIAGPVAEAVVAMIEGKQPSDWVFSTRSGKPWRHPDFEYDRWRQGVFLAKQCGLGRHVTIHMLRHTFAVWALYAGTPIQEVSYKLGHASIQITWDTYGGYVGDDGRMATVMAEQMKMAEQAIAPGKVPTRAEVEGQPVREKRGRSAA